MDAIQPELGHVRLDAWEDAQVNEVRMHGLTEDGGRRYDAFRAWVDSKPPEEPLWTLDSVGVEPAAQRRGIGSALVEHGLARAGRIGVSMETERFGFRVVEHADAPDGGPHISFLRRDPPAEPSGSRG
jgi:GNAT superfamily N-acetyltransferase